jgi:hypothetical protein
VFRDTRKSTQFCTRAGAWTITIYRVASGTTKTVNEPAPGGQVTVRSPQELPDGCPTRTRTASLRQACAVSVDVESSLATFNEAVLAEGEVTFAEIVGDLVVQCWFLADLAGDGGKVAPGQQLKLCLELVKLIVKEVVGRKPSAQVSTRPFAMTQPLAGPCRATRHSFAVDMNGKRFVSAKPIKTTLTAKSVRYSCTASGGKMKIKVDGRVKGGLRKALGPTLDLRIVRPAGAAARRGKLTLRFNW